jgi:hypothetical protein
MAHYFLSHVRTALEMESRRLLRLIEVVEAHLNNTEIITTIRC